MTPEQTAKVRELNDAFRTNPFGDGGRTVLTNGVSSLGLVFSTQAHRMVQQFNDFNANNDPHGEHDWGTFPLDGEVVNWKIDYYDAELQDGSEAPWDEAVTKRVLTIMLLSES